MTVIREMGISDYDAVIHLWGETEHMSLRDADSQHSIGVYLQRNPGLSFVAADNNVVIGAVLVGTDGRRGYLQHLAVSCEHRGQGIGRQLVAASVKALAAMGIAKTHLFVYRENVKAQTFYQQSGWFLRDDVSMYSFNSSVNDNV
ncbi:GNAT family N-acetyltransferase [uncultured Amphritea sp.]|uniref:GNAT family N-acetyltransferase n=1 Tax=uncultured Amphritea sp. TaxID=981605 RepID=UPI00261AFA0B|nr:GNAT family N-acetyltransferase [uncultured Amphritea sp.]